ncbi:MAG: NTP transferase domain-containing protein, partial [Deltaproteobacteria bacterium]|nr:NTP transferase domain-containing protein [Deltaproteobacteria bacterium]
MQIHKAVIPAAGLGTRLLPATKSQPKEMLPVGRKPTIQYVVEELYAAGIKHILIITSGQKRAIEDHFDIDVVLTNRLKRGNKSLSVLDHVELDIQLFYIRQKVLAGLGDAIGLAENFVSDEPFIVALGDSIIKSEHPGSLLKRLMNTHLAHNAGATIAFREVERKNVVKYGIAVPKDEPGMEFELRDIIEKPTIKSAPSNLAVAARYVFSSDIFAYIEKTPPGAGGEIQITGS